MKTVSSSRQSPNPFVPKLITAFAEGYTLSKFQKDIIAGIIVGIVAIPLSIAFAIASGARPEQGIVTAIIAGFLASLTSGSMYQISGPTGAFVILVFSTISRYGYQGMLIATFLAGILLIIAGLCRLGAVIKLIPHSVTVGFTAGIAVLIATSQMIDFLGIKLDLGNTNILKKWGLIASHLFDANPAAVLMGAFTILLMQLWARLKTGFPGAFLAILGCTFATRIFSLPCQTIGDRYGDFAFSLPQFSLPSINLAMVPELLPPAIAIAILAGIESLLSAVVADGMTGRRHRSHAELISQGFANVGSSIFGGLPATGAIARTATNIKSGAVSPISGIFHAFFILISMLFFGSAISWVPLPALAGVLLVVAYNMVERDPIIAFFRGPVDEAATLLATFLLTIFAGLIEAIEIGVVMALLIRFAKRKFNRVTS